MKIGNPIKCFKLAKFLALMLMGVLFCSFSLNSKAIEKTYKDKKIYDQNKNDSLNQKSACWAASTANILKAWQDYLKKNYYLSPPLGTPSTLNEIYERVYSFGYLKAQKISADAGSVPNGISWFIAGISYNSEAKRFESSPTGGFYKELYNGITSPNDLVKLHNISEDKTSLKALEAIFENSLKKDSKISISISDDTFNIHHAITFWAYETKNNKLSSIFITDSDDDIKGKRECKLIAYGDKIYLSDYSSTHKFYIRSLVEFNMLLPPTLKDRYVSAEKGNDNNSGETWQKAFKSLDAAINSIKLVASSEEDYTIHLEEGTYALSSDILVYPALIGGVKKDVVIQNKIENSAFKILGGYSLTNKNSPRSKTTTIEPTAKSPMSLVYIKNSKVTFDSIVFDAKKQTKGLYITNNSKVTLNNCIVKNAKSTTSGAGIYSDGILKIKNSQIINNASSATGAGIYSNGELSIEGSIISFNAGGAIYSQGKFYADKSKISDNTSPTTCAGIVSNGYAYIKNSSIFNNVSKSSVGGLYVKGDLNLLNSTISKNSAKECGAVYLDNQSAKVHINYCTIAENSSLNSPDIYIKSIPNFSINNSIIWKNTIYNLNFLNAKNSIIEGYKSNAQKNVFNAVELLKNNYAKALIWNKKGFYEPSFKFLISKDKSELKDQLSKERNQGCVGAVEYQE